MKTDVLIKAKQGDQAAMFKVIKSFEGWVVKQCHYYKLRGYEVEDLKQVCYQALIYAVYRLDEDELVTAPSFILRCMQNALKFECRKVLSKPEPESLNRSAETGLEFVEMLADETKDTESEVLHNLDKKGLNWADDEPLMSYMVSHDGTSFPYGLNVRGDKVSITTPFLTHDIVFDGRTEPEPVKVSKEVMEELKEYVDDHTKVWLYDFSIYPESVDNWLQEDRAERVKLLVDYIEGNRTLITTEQYVVRSIDPDENNDYSYLRLGAQSTSVPDIEVAQFELEEATHFETREEATEFLIAGMEIVEV